MDVSRHADATRAAAPADYFTGDVTLERQFSPPGEARAAVALVTFQPGARTNWHTHPYGQTLLVTAGEGWVRTEGGPRQTVRPGDHVWFDAGERHWHGATDGSAMTHVAVQETRDGSAADWGEPVSDADYLDG